MPRNMTTLFLLGALHDRMIVYLVLIGFVNHNMLVVTTKAAMKPKGCGARIQSHDDMLS